LLVNGSNSLLITGILRSGFGCQVSGVRPAAGKKRPVKSNEKL
jgi:hypothetical protein